MYSTASNFSSYHPYAAASSSLGGVFGGGPSARHGYSSYSSPSLAPSSTMGTKHSSVALVRPVQFSSVNLASTQQSANLRWSSAQEAVNFMDHLYFLTNFVLEYLLESELPQELLNQNLLNDPLTVLSDNRNELIKHFHKLLIAACTCLCIGISIPLFGFLLACCWCSSGSKTTRSKRSSRGYHRSSRPSSNSRNVTSRSRGQRESYDADCIALSSTQPVGRHSRRPASGAGHSRHHQHDVDHRQWRSRNHHRRSASSSGASLTDNHRSRSVPPSLRYESSCHPCLRTFFSSNLFIVLLFISFFAVCAFVTNEYVNQGVKQLPRALNQSVEEMQTYLNNTEYEIDNLFRVNYNQLESEISSRLDVSGSIIKHKLAVKSEAIALVNLTDIVMEFNDTKSRLERLDNELSKLRSRLNTAKLALIDIKKKIENCPPDQCQLLRTKYNNLDEFRVISHFERLPDVKQLIKKVSLIIESGIIAQVQKGRDDFEKLGTIIQTEVQGTRSTVKVQLSAVGRKLADLSSDIGQSIRWSDQLFNRTKTTTRKLNQYTDYEQYRRYACLGGATVILFILLCYTIGWLYGSCRPQPTARTYKTRAKTSASSSFPFSCGIVTVFFIFLPMILAAIILFMTGSVGDKIVCRVIKHPEQQQSKQIYAMLQNKFLGADLSVSSTTVNEDKVTIEQIDGKAYRIYRPNFADLLSRCHQNQSIYKVLKLDQYDKVYLMDDVNGKKILMGFDKSFNLHNALEFKRINNIDTKLKDLTKLIELDLSKITLLSSAAEETLDRTIGQISFDDLENSFARIYDNGVTITPIDIEVLIKDIQAQKAAAPNSESVESVLTLASIFATSFQDQILPNITSSLLNLKEGVRHLKLRMFHGRNNFGVVIRDLIPKIRSAEKQLRSNGSTLVKNSVVEFIDELNALIDQYASHAKNQVESVIGQCEPVSRAINSTTFALCDDIILPFNGYWFSTISSLLLILPATLLAYALKALYSFAKRTAAMHHNYNYADQEDEISYEDDSEDVALAYHIGHHSHLSHKPSGSSAMPSAPLAADDGWSPTSAGYLHNARPPPYAV